MQVSTAVDGLWSRHLPKQATALDLDLERLLISDSEKRMQCMDLPVVIRTYRRAPLENQPSREIGGKGVTLRRLALGWHRRRLLAVEVAYFGAVKSATVAEIVRFEGIRHLPALSRSLLRVCPAPLAPPAPPAPPASPAPHLPSLPPPPPHLHPFIMTAIRPPFPAGPLMTIARPLNRFGHPLCQRLAGDAGVGRPVLVGARADAPARSS